VSSKSDEQSAQFDTFSCPIARPLLVRSAAEEPIRISEAAKSFLAVMAARREGRRGAACCCVAWRGRRRALIQCDPRAELHGPCGPGRPRNGSSSPPAHPAAQPAQCGMCRIHPAIRRPAKQNRSPSRIEHLIVPRSSVPAPSAEPWVDDVRSYAHSSFGDSPGLSRPECPKIKRPTSAARGIHRMSIAEGQPPDSLSATAKKSSAALAVGGPSRLKTVWDFWSLYPRPTVCYHCAAARP